MARPSRKKRKRNHRRLQVEAIAPSPKLCGGWGNGLPVSRSDFLLVRKAIREGWPVSGQARQLVVADVYHVADTAVSARMLAAAAWVVVDMEGRNQQVELACQN